MQFLREWSFLMRGTRAERIFEELQKFLSPRSIWQKVLVPHHSFLKSFGTPATKLKIAQNVCVSPLQYFSYLDIENYPIQKRANLKLKTQKYI